MLRDILLMKAIISFMPPLGEADNTLARSCACFVMPLTALIISSNLTFGKTSVNFLIALSRAGTNFVGSLFFNAPLRSWTNCVKIDWIISWFWTIFSMSSGETFFGSGQPIVFCGAAVKIF